MLVTFSCKQYGNIVMFGDVAVNLLHLMGHSGSIPGAILAADLPDALEKLELGLKKQRPTPSESKDNEAEQSIGLKHRAIPLIDMIKTAIAKDCNLMWK